MWPVIVRELRAESRRPFTYWLRVIGAAAILGAVLFTIGQPDRWRGNSTFGAVPIFQSHQIMGRLLFGNVNAALFALIWLIVPLLTADCINREKREGTLGLLFLTPLSARGIVVGKSLAHGLRALTLFLTALPVIAVPILMGGVGPKDFCMALLIDLSALLLALAAGLIASSWTTKAMSSLLLAETLSFVFAVIAMHIHFGCFQAIMRFAAKATPASPFGGVSGWTSYSESWRGHGGGFLGSLLHLFYFNTSSHIEINPVWMGRGVALRMTFGGTWNSVWTSGNGATSRLWFCATGLLFFGALIFFAVAVLMSAWRIRGSWRLRAPTARALQIERKFCEPRYLPKLFRRTMRRSLERNPIGWLQQYSVAARMTKWGWCLFVILVESLFTLNLNDVDTGQTFVFSVLVLAMAFSASGSFRRDRESGALELLLVTPLRVWQIVLGRIGGIWRQFLPALTLAAGAAFYVSTFGGFFLDQSHLVDFFASVVVLLGSFFAVPVIGLYWSLRRTSYLVSWIGAVVTSLLVPWGCAAIGQRIDLASPGIPLFLSFQLVAAIFCGVRLVSNLSARRFVIAT